MTDQLTKQPHGGAQATPAKAGSFLLMQGISKSYGGVPVLTDVTIGFERGRVHGLVGENGAGKSTLMKILAGIIRPDRGAVLKDGTPIRVQSPRDALAHGVTMITQELSLVPRRSVLENVLMGRLAQRGGWVQSRANHARFLELRDEVGFDDLDPQALAGALPLAKQLRVEIMRAIARNAEVIIMDEPTAVLTTSDAEQLLVLMQRLADSNIAVVFISHYLEQALSVTDTLGVLRDGRLVTGGPTVGQTADTLVRSMVGRQVDVLYPEPEPVPHNAPVVLAVRDLRRGQAVRGVSFEIRRGEILGVAGLVGSGRSETARLIFGAERADAGEVVVNGKTVHPSSPSIAMRAGIALVPEDRKTDGLVLGRSVRENISLASLGELSAGGVLKRRKERRETTALMERTDIRAATTEGPVWTLSGGNQQKTMFSKWLLRRPQLLIVDEPTRGVDVAAKVQIHQLLRDLAAAGHAILLISSENEEVIGMSHRVCVMRQGRIAATFQRGDTDTEAILATAFDGLGGEDRGRKA
ncbi:MAG: sugar ABC transporter ATP-binding protein [Thermoleophilia bacterium]|nr:sugar ABC transporter ATP-binding protein [Thermoleophilia bacterium]